MAVVEKVPFEGSEDVSGCGGIQAGGGLIHEQQGRFGHQLQTNVHPLALPSTVDTPLLFALARRLMVQVLMKCALAQCLTGEMLIHVMCTCRMLAW